MGKGGGHVDWKGGEVVDHVTEASKYGVDKTLAECVMDAKSNHAFENQTGLLEGSVQSRPAEKMGLLVKGMWGSFTVAYAIFIEAGTVNITAMPFLRPAADRNYPNLAANIKAGMPQ